MPKRKGILVTVNDEVYEKVKLWANKMGVTMSSLGGMAITAGLDSIIRSVDPINSVSAEKWAEIMIAMKAAGVEVKSGKE